MNLNIMDSGEILAKALGGAKLFPDEAIHLAAEGDLLNLAMAAGAMNKRQDPEGTVGYTVNKTIVYSNICQPNCPFCSGTVTREDEAAFTKTADEVLAEAQDAVDAGATQLILQGGHRIDLPWDYYTGLVRALHERFPQVQILAYSPTEIMVFNAVYQKKTADILGDLKAAGMGGLLAGGSPTMATRTKEYRALLRGPWNEWFDVVHRCHDLRLPVIAPFAFGLGEDAKERVGHLYRIRSVQERTAMKDGDKGVFSALLVFSLNPAGMASVQQTEQHVVHVEGEAVKVNPVQQVAKVSGHQYLRMVALARVLVPNVRRIQSNFVNQGAKVAQVALDGGANDMGGTYMEFQSVELAAGRVGPMTPVEMQRLIREAGRIPQLAPTI